MTSVARLFSKVEIGLLLFYQMEEHKLAIYLDNVRIVDYAIPDNLGSWDLVDLAAASTISITAGTHVLTMKNPVADGLKGIDFNFALFTLSKATAKTLIISIYYSVRFKNRLTLSNVPTHSVVSVYSITGSKLLEAKKREHRFFPFEYATLTTVSTWGSCIQQ